MPFCSQCGNQVDTGDVYCAKCGFRQPVAPPRPADPFASITPRTASILCYVPGLGWIGSIIVLASHRYRQDRTVRFHAFQGLYLFVAWLIVQWVFSSPGSSPWAPHNVPVVEIMKLALLVLSIFMMVKASEEKPYSLPILGELAERSLTEK